MADVNECENAATKADNKETAVPLAPPMTEVPKTEEIVTSEILSSILERYNESSDKNCELVDFEAKLGTIAGDNYMSIIYSVKMNLKNVENGERETLPVMLKVLPRNELRVKIINEGNIFLRDVKMYSEIVPAMEAFQRETVGLSDEEMCAPWPKCFACKSDGKGDFLAMEDLKEQGYKMASRQLGLDFEHCKLVLKEMARFHAVSYAMFRGDYDKIMEKYPWLDETMFKDDKIPQVWRDMIRETYKQQAATVREAGEELGAHLLENIFTENYFQELYELVGAKRRWAVIGHGDCWTNNILFRYDEETNKPVDVKFVDYQVSRASSRAVDIHYFLYSSPPINVLNEREKELEEIYFEEFTKFAKTLGVDVDGQELTKENFEQEIETIRYYGVVSGFMLALVTSADSTDVPEMETMTEEDMEGEAGKNFLLNMMKEKAILKVKNLAGVHLPRCKQVEKHLP